MEIGKARRAAHLKLGRRGEADAAALLRSKSYRILATDYRVKAGELDIVALDGATMVFVEVKTLRRKGRFRPADNLGLKQFRRNIMAAKYFCRQHHWDMPCRFDLVEVWRGRFILHEIRHFCNIWNRRLGQYDDEN